MGKVSQSHVHNRGLDLRLSKPISFQPISNFHFQNDEPPEITYCVVEANGTLQALTPTQPMPPQAELDARFAELVEELDLSAPNKAAMLSLPSHKKWQIYCSRKLGVESGAETNQEHAPEHYIQKLKEFEWHEDFMGGDEDDLIKTNTKLVDGLKTALRTSTHSFVMRFIELGGLGALLDCLSALPYSAAQSSLHTSLIGCIKALMNNSVSITRNVKVCLKLSYVMFTAWAGTRLSTSNRN